jgi:nucleoside-diphosphate kinase
LSQPETTESTLLLVKPDAVRARRTGEVLRRLEDAGFTISGLIMRRLSADEAGKFYAIHRDKAFFDGLVEFMTSGPLVAVRLEGTNSRRRLREFVGTTDPSLAAPGTIRADFGTAVRTNAVHASNPDEDVEREIRFFFPDAKQS